MSSSRERVRLETTSRLAPAKVNLALHVTGRRADGYHTLSSLVAFASHGDRVTASPAEEDSFALSGPFADALGFTALADNIVVRALVLARAVAADAGLDFGPLAVSLEKRLPVAAGIGGGSADAAALLRMLTDACPDISARMRAVSLGIGADVPMCFDGVAARVEGIGEIGMPLPAFPAVPCLLVNPGIPVSTPEVFRRLERTANPALPPLPPLQTFADLLDCLKGSRNDLQAAALSIAPGIGTACDGLTRHGAAFARMSGSGATVFGLFEDAGQAAAAGKVLARDHPDWWTLPTTLMPAAGEEGG